MTEDDDAREKAELSHNLLISGWAVWQSDLVEPDVSLLAAALPALQIAEMACTEASSRGTLARIQQELDMLVCNHAEEVTWSTADNIQYQRFLRLNEEADRILESIHDSVFVDIMRRYHLEEVAEIFEKNRETFEIRLEVGRRLIQPTKVRGAMSSSHAIASLSEKYGDRCGRRLERRLARFGLGV